MMTEGLLEDFDLTGKVQIVPFHPRFVFGEGNDDEDELDDDAIEDSDTQEIDNQLDNDPMEYWTNRSPYPMFHILKEDDVSRAVQLMKGDTDRVWQRNVHLLQHLEEHVTTSNAPGNESELDTDLRTQLEDYLLSGKDEPEGTIKTMVQKALSETAREFPMLEKPLRDSKESDA